MIATTEPSNTRWYGWQTLILDGMSFATFAVSEATQTDGGVSLALLSYLIGPAIVHAGHQQWGASGASVALRLVLPLAGLISGMMATPACSGSNPCGAGVQPGDSNPDGGRNALLGVGLGTLAASLLDGFVLARQPNESQARGAMGPLRHEPRAAPRPTAGFVRGGAVGGLTVSF
jgi:hypothetical protein